MRKYIPAKTIADSIGYSERHVYRLAEKENWESREFEVNGRKERRFYLPSLPVETRKQMLTPLVLDELRDALSLSGDAEKLANAKMHVVQLMRDCRVNNGMPLREFAEKYKEIAPAELLEVIPRVSKSTLAQWEKQLVEKGSASLARKKRKDAAKTTLPEKWHALVLAAYLDQNRRSMRSIYMHIIHKAALDELGENPNFAVLAKKKEELKKAMSEKTVRNFIHNNVSSGLALKTRGIKNQREKVRAYVKRTRDSLKANDIWVSDGHDTNNFVLDTNGDIVRPVIICWMDEKSRFITGWDIDTTEHTDLITTSLANGVELHGIPSSVYVDNGKAYINRRTSDKFNTENENKTYAMLGCNVITARPYNAREKSIERFWGTLDNNFSKYLPGYTGANTLTKPENIDAPKHLLSIDEYRDAFVKFITKYNTDASFGEGMDGECPYIVYKNNLEHKKEAPADVLVKMRLVHLPEERVIRSGGVVRVKNREYIDAELLLHVGSKVNIALDPSNLDLAYIYLKGELIAKARGLKCADFEDTPNTQAAWRQAAKIKAAEKKLNNKIKKLKQEGSALLLESHKTPNKIDKKVSSIPVIDIAKF